MAAQSITLLRDEACLLPLPASANLLVVETPLAAGLGRALGATTMQVGTQPKPTEISTVLDLARGGRTVIVATADVAKNQPQADLVKALLEAKVPTVVVAMRSPYDLLYLKGNIPTYLAAYGSSPPSLEAVAAAAEYCDVVSFNIYRSHVVAKEWEFTKTLNKPVIIGEFHFGSLATGLLQPGLRYAADPEERAAFYEFYVKSALNNPYLVGTHWFQLTDQAVTGRSDGENYQAGFLTVGDRPQKEIIAMSREIGKNMYLIRTAHNSE
jgi:hypothetical protein